MSQSMRKSLNTIISQQLSVLAYKAIYWIVITVAVSLFSGLMYFATGTLIAVGATWLLAAACIGLSNALAYLSDKAGY